MSGPKVIDIPINASPSAPKIVEIDAEIVMQIIVRTTHARPKPAAKAANEIMDYLITCIRLQASVS